MQKNLCMPYAKINWNILVQSLSSDQLFATPWPAAQQDSLSITNSRSLFKLMSIESVMRVTISSSIVPFSSCLQSFPASGSYPASDSVLHIRWPDYWNFSFGISPSNEYSGLISFRMDWFDLFAVQGTLKSLLFWTSQFKSISSSVLSFLYTQTLTSIPDHWQNRSFD